MMFNVEYPKLFNSHYLLIKYINFKRYFVRSILNRKESKYRLQKLIEIMENKDEKKILITYKP